MLVSGGEIERLRPMTPAQFRIGAGSTSHRSAVQGELERAQKTIRGLEGQERALNGLFCTLTIAALVC